jgi:hypothetical protein
MSIRELHGMVERYGLTGHYIEKKDMIDAIVEHKKKKFSWAIKKDLRKF